MTVMGHGAFVAPDGGWGWMIVVAYALCNFVLIPTIGSFGLIFKDSYIALGLTATDISLITNVNAAVGMSMGLINGPLLKRFGCRPVGICAGLLMSGGFALTAGAASMTAFIVSYGVVTACGCGLALSAFSLSLNQYFNLRRNYAIGIGMTLTGLGPILYPPLIAVLLHNYGTAGCVLILSALCTHVVLAALLLHPVEWHRRAANDASGGIEVELMTLGASDAQSQQVPAYQRSISVEERSAKPAQISADHHVDAQSIYGADQISLIPTLAAEHRPAAGVSYSSIPAGTSTAANGHTSSNPTLAIRRHAPHFERSISHVIAAARPPSVETPGTSTRSPTGWKPFLRWFDSGSVPSVHLASSVDVFGESAEHYRIGARSSRPMSMQRMVVHMPDMPPEINETPSSNTPAPAPAPAAPFSLTGWLVNFFDLRLFTDAVYVNIMLGMSLAVFAELNFSILTPFLLHDLGFTTAQIASSLSALACADITARFAAPFVLARLSAKVGPRVVYMCSLALLIAARFGILGVDNLNAMLGVCVALGLAKGVRIVYMQLVIPAHVPLERLASAAGMQMVINGLVIMLLGPLVGVIRDWTGSYTRCIWFLNGISTCTLCMWTLEFAVRSIRTARTRRRCRAAVAAVAEETLRAELTAAQKRVAIVLAS